MVAGRSAADTALASRRALDRQRRNVLFVVFVAVATLVLVAQVGEIFEEAELPTIDTRFRVRGTDGPPSDLLVVRIDDVTLQELGEPWPFSLESYSRAIVALTDAGAEVIVLDIPGDRTDSDPAFLDALAAAPAVTLSPVRSNTNGAPIVLGGSDALEIEGVRASDGRFEPDDDGVVRRFDHTLQDDDEDDDDDDESEDAATTGLTDIPTLPAVVVEQLSGQKLPADVTGSEGATIDLPGPAGTVPQVSFPHAARESRAASHRPTECVSWSRARVRAGTRLACRGTGRLQPGLDPASCCADCGVGRGRRGNGRSELRIRGARPPPGARSVRPFRPAGGRPRHHRGRSER
ncbi:MAG: hypothetical protein ACI8Y4_003167 [Candidatus Poriferisodalaceae bacterium]|jgi:hypothetical protein